MQTCFLPGFATNALFYKEFLQYAPGLEYIPNPSFTYEEVKAALLKKAAGKRIKLVGWSLGALYALRWASEHPQLTASLFLTGATARFCATADYNNGIREKTLLLMIKQLSANPGMIMENFYQSALAGVPDKQQKANALLDAQFPVENLLNGLQALQTTDLLAALTAIDVPVVIYQGVNDSITPLSGARILSSRLPAAALIEEPEGGHCLLLQYPEKTAERINYES